jgi:hypothetical protein
VLVGDDVRAVIGSKEQLLDAIMASFSRRLMVGWDAALSFASTPSYT